MKQNIAEKIALWADKLRDHTAMGLRFSENIYDQIRYRAIQDIAMEMNALATGKNIGELEPLRSTFFSRPTPLVVGDAAVIDASGRILLMQRADNQKWAMPGGAMEVGETPAAGVVREVMEETGLRCKVKALVGVFDSRSWGFVSPNHLYVISFLCQPLEGMALPYQAYETLETGWFPEDNLPDAMHPGHRERIPVAFRVWRGDPHAFFDP
jgi:ADP-ribose pyrophosphatase YjhB (NUDIX family)